MASSSPSGMASSRAAMSSSLNSSASPRSLPERKGSSLGSRRPSAVHSSASRHDRHNNNNTISDLSPDGLPSLNAALTSPKPPSVAASTRSVPRDPREKVAEGLPRRTFDFPEPPPVPEEEIFKELMAVPRKVLSPQAQRILNDRMADEARAHNNYRQALADLKKAGKAGSRRKPPPPTAPPPREVVVVPSSALRAARPHTATLAALIDDSSRPAAFLSPAVSTRPRPRSPSTRRAARSPCRHCGPQAQPRPFNPHGSPRPTSPGLLTEDTWPYAWCGGGHPQDVCRCGARTPNPRDHTNHGGPEHGWAHSAPRGGYDAPHGHGLGHGGHGAGGHVQHGPHHGAAWPPPHGSPYAPGHPSARHGLQPANAPHWAAPPVGPHAAGDGYSPSGTVPAGAVGGMWPPIGPHRGALPSEYTSLSPAPTPSFAHATSPDLPTSTNRHSHAHPYEGDGADQAPQFPWPPGGLRDAAAGAPAPLSPDEKDLFDQFQRFLRGRDGGPPVAPEPQPPAPQSMSVGIGTDPPSLEPIDRPPRLVDAATDPPSLAASVVHPSKAPSAANDSRRSSAVGPPKLPTVPSAASSSSASVVPPPAPRPRGRSLGTQTPPPAQRAASPSQTPPIVIAMRRAPSPSYGRQWVASGAVLASRVPPARSPAYAALASSGHSIAAPRLLRGSDGLDRPGNAHKFGSVAFRSPQALTARYVPPAYYGPSRDDDPGPSASQKSLQQAY